jgi:glucuronoarabinoxylan endo-1,4-beta-xylanase
MILSIRRGAIILSSTVLALILGCGGGSGSGSSSGGPTNNKTTPTITWATPQAITYGTALSATQLNATSSVAGTFTYSPALGTVLTAGTQALSVTFTPTDSTDYNSATGQVSLTVKQATPVVTWDQPVPVAYGSWLGSTTLSAIASVKGTFAYTPAVGTQMLTLGPVTLSLTFTPTDTNYSSVTTTVPLTVTQGTPSISWSAPAPVVQGSALTATQLNATPSIPGTTTYSPALGTVMNTPGTTILTANFTPTDSTDYTASSTTTALTVVPSSGNAMIDYGAASQTIRGFGASEAWYGVMSSASINALYGTASGDLGLSIMRIRIAPATWTASTQTADTTAWTTELTNAKAAQTLGASIFATPWTPPPSMKINNASRGNGTESGILSTSFYSDYANYLKDYVTYATSMGVSLYAISMQNEPDWDPMTYESCLWTAGQMDSWAAQYGSVPTTGTSVRLMMPESLAFLPQQSNAALNDSSAAANISIIAGHLYGSSPTYPTLAKSKGMELWETEHYLDSVNASSTASSWSTSIGDALAVAKEIHTAMTLGQYNAYNWWWLQNSNDSTPTGLLDSKNNPTYFGIGMEHFARFVRPGYQRVNATSNPVSGVYLSAYSGDGHQVIVVINTNSSTVSLPIQINNQSVTSLTPYLTTSTASVAEQTPITITSNSFTASLPAQSITTFVQ